MRISDDANVLLTLVSQDFKLIRKGRYFTTDEHDSLIIDPRKALFFWNSRGLMGDAVSYLIQVRGLNYGQAIDSLGKTIGKFNYEVYEAKPSDPNPALVDIYFNYGQDYLDYWYEVRGYTDETIRKFKLGYSGEYWVIPIFVDGKFRNFQKRGFDRYGNKINKHYYENIGRLPFNFDVLPEDYSAPIYIAEGLVDAIMLSQDGRIAISQNTGSNGWNHEWSHQLMNYEQIYIVYDNDEAGRYGARRTAKYLRHNSHILIWPKEFPKKYDITDLYKSGGSIDDLYDNFLPSYML